MRIKKITLGLATTLVASALFSCAQAEPAHNHNYVEHNAVTSTCATQGNSEYYTCSGCEKLFSKSGEEYTEIQSVPVLALNPENHEGTISLLVSGIKAEYIVGEQIDKSTLAVTLKCDKCEGRRLSNEEYEVQYPTQGENKFVIADVGENKTLTVKSGNYEAKLSVSVLAKPHDYELHSAVASTCATQGHAEYYTCKDCDKLFVKNGEEYVVIQSIPVLELDPKNHEEKVSLVVSGYETTYTVGDEINSNLLSVVEKCDACEGYALDASDYSIEYPSENETRFVAADVGENKTVTILSGENKAEFTVSVVKKANEITGFTNLEEHCGFAPFKSLEGVSATYGTIVYKFAETIDGTYVTVDEIDDDYVFVATSGEESTVFYYKAIVEATAEYEGVEKTGTITISHDHKWDLTAEDVDTFGCVCGDSYYEFDKVVDMDEQHLVLTSDDKSLALTGTSYNSEIDTIKSIMLGEVSLGTSLDELDFINVTEEMYGHQTIVVTVTSSEIGSMPEADHEIEVSVVISQFDLIPEQELGEMTDADESL